MKIYIVVLFWYETPLEIEILKGFNNEYSANEYKLQYKAELGDIIEVRKIAIHP